MKREEFQDQRIARRMHEHAKPPAPGPAEASGSGIQETLLGGSGEPQDAGRNSGRGSEETRRNGG